MLRPPPSLTVSEWSDTFRVLSRETSAEPGRWRTERVPYMKGPLDCFSDPQVERVVMMFGSQVSKTEGGICNVVGYFIDQDPAPMLIVQPREFDAKKFSKKRLAPMIRDTPCLREKVRPARARDTDNTILEKAFSGGSIVLAGANAPAGLAGDPIRIVLLDEVDRYPPSAGAEGDPVELAEMRSATFSNRKIGMTSSPTDAGTSRIEKAYEDSDQRHYFVPCPHCEGAQTLKWDQVKWDKDEEGQHRTETARYVCELCGEDWSEAQRHEAVRLGEWVASEGFSGTAGFHLNALYAPWANLSLPKLAAKWIKAQGRPLLLKAFLNTVLAECWEEKYKKAPDDLDARREAYPEREGRVVVPAGVVLMTCGVDIQDDRIEAQIQGYGRSEESWKLQYHVLNGDPSTKVLWEDLWELLCTPLEMERGGVDYIRATCVDTGGHHTQAAYNFCRPRFRVATPDGRRAFVFAIKGQGGAGGDIWPREASRNNKGKVALYNIRVDPAKESLYSSLHTVVEPGPGYVHFPLTVATGREFDERYFDQLTAERCVTRHDGRGFPRNVWELKSEGRANEALDTSNYGLAAYYGLASMGLDIEREADRIDEADPTRAMGAPAPAKRAGKAEPDSTPAAQPGVKRKRRRASRSSYLG